MTQEEFLTVLRQSKAEGYVWTLDHGTELRARKEFDGFTHVFCPLTVVAFIHLNEHYDPSGWGDASTALGLPENWGSVVVNAADNREDFDFDESRELRRKFIEILEPGEPALV